MADITNNLKNTVRQWLELDPVPKPAGEKLKEMVSSVPSSSDIYKQLKGTGMTPDKIKEALDFLAYQARSTGMKGNSWGDVLDAGMESGNLARVGQEVGEAAKADASKNKMLGLGLAALLLGGGGYMALKDDNKEMLPSINSLKKRSAMNPEEDFIAQLQSAAQKQGGVPNPRQAEAKEDLESGALKTLTGGALLGSTAAGIPEKITDAVYYGAKPSVAKALATLLALGLGGYSAYSGVKDLKNSYEQGQVKELF